jgi:hypothetical protein
MKVVVLIEELGNDVGFLELCRLPAKLADGIHAVAQRRTSPAHFSTRRCGAPKQCVDGIEEAN